MLLFAADTSGKNGSIALAKCSPGNCDVIEVVPLEGGTFSAQLIPQLAALLKKHGFHKTDLEGFAVASGPGSFTGLRVGLSAIKALAEILQKPIAAVSLLEAIAAAGGINGKVIAALDAGRNEIYVGEYEIGSKRTMLSEQLFSTEEFLAFAKRKPVITPDKRIAELAHNGGIVSKEIERPTSADIACLGWLQIQAGNVVPPEQLEANYIRRSDAEIFSKPLS